jgi:CheY-like chemotaxis protein
VHPRGILLDLHMPDLSGEGVLDALRRDPATRSIPVAIVTSQLPAEPLRRKLLDHGCVILSKQDLSADALAQSLNL